MSGDLETAEREVKLAMDVAAASGMTGWIAGQSFRHGRLALRRGQLVLAEKILAGRVARDRS